MPPTYEQKEWAQAGKVLLILSGLACLGLAFYEGHDALHLALRVWVGSFGAFAVFVALKDAWASRA